MATKAKEPVSRGLQNPSVLAMSRKIDVSVGAFGQGLWDNRGVRKFAPVHVHEKAMMGTISPRSAANTPDVLKNGNLVTVDSAALSLDNDTLEVSFTVRITGDVGTPSACNNAEYQAKLEAMVKGYIAEVGFAELATRYACNIANGRFLWRNRVGVDSAEVHVSQIVGGKAEREWVFDALSLPLRDFEEAAHVAGPQGIADLAQAIGSGLSGNQHVLLYVKAYARIGYGQEVYPSQELVVQRVTGEKSKTLCRVWGDAAGMHSQKLANALRTIDTWYPAYQESNHGPVPIEPFAALPMRSVALRMPSTESDFYTLLDRWIRGGVIDDQSKHFVVANLIRGGVFADSSKE